MFTRVLLSIIFGGVLSNGAIAAPGVPENQVLADYVKVQEALANDSIAEAKEAADAVAKSTSKKAIKEAAAKVSKSADLASARTAFKDLSEAVLPMAKAQKSATYEVYNCPMKKANWVQKKGAIANPYLGKEMQTCGEKVK